MTWPLISDDMGAAPSPLWLQVYSEDIRVEVRSEGVELEEVLELPLEGAEVSELPLEEVVKSRVFSLELSLI